MDPAVKRLAMEVEDHPLAYSTCEGTIPKDEYGGGSVMLWDTGEFGTKGDGSAERQGAKGHLRLQLEGDRLQGKFDLMRMRGKATGKEWLLVKGADGHGTEGWNVDDYEFSVGRQRTQSEIASGSAGRPVPRAVAMKPMLAQKLPEGPD